MEVYARAFNHPICIRDFKLYDDYQDVVVPTGRRSRSTAFELYVKCKRERFRSFW
jgi:hypothetical protein